MFFASTFFIQLAVYPDCCVFILSEMEGRCLLQIIRPESSVNLVQFEEASCCRLLEWGQRESREQRTESTVPRQSARNALCSENE